MRDCWAIGTYTGDLRELYIHMYIYLYIYIDAYGLGPFEGTMGFRA